MFSGPGNKVIAIRMLKYRNENDYLLCLDLWTLLLTQISSFVDGYEIVYSPKYRFDLHRVHTVDLKKVVLVFDKF